MTTKIHTFIFWVTTPCSLLQTAERHNTEHHNINKMHYFDTAIYRPVENIIIFVAIKNKKTAVTETTETTNNT
jgi:hypothetical protein